MQNLSNKQITTIYTNVEKNPMIFKWTMKHLKVLQKLKLPEDKNRIWLVVIVLASSAFPVSVQWVTKATGISVFQNTADGRVNES